jgi:hypothetical protein
LGFAVTGACAVDALGKLRGSFHKCTYFGINGIKIFLAKHAITIVDTCCGDLRKYRLFL